ncbi:hypothetical protein ACE0DR_06260 [Azotobacter sp. CWF10]
MQSLVDEVLAELETKPAREISLTRAASLIRQQQQELTAIEAMARMLADGEWAEHVGQLGGPIAQRLESEITRMHNEQQALIAQQGAPVAVPDGWRFVPAKPTDEMIRNAHRQGHACATSWYIAMLSAAPTPPAQQSQAALDVLAERRRQIEAEGWTPEHDDKYLDDELAMAAVCYLEYSPELCGPEAPSAWPWDEAWWKPSDRRRDLVKAGALILAEIERLDRADKKELSNV